MKKFYLFLTVLMIMCVGLSANWVDEQKVTASDGAESDLFGRSISINGNYAIIGANYDDDNGDDSGSVYIFHQSGTTWTEQAKLTASDGASGDQFGISVSIDGDYAVVGAWNNSSSGSAYIFHRSGTTWTEQAKLTASDAYTNDQFGVAVSISGDYAVVGSWLDDDNGTNSGSTYIFLRSGTTWTEQAKLTASDGASDDYFGGSVSIKGEYAIIGSYEDDDNGTGSGSAYIFHRSGATWTEQQKLIASDGAEEDSFGGSVSIDGDYAVIGAHGDDDNGDSSGSAYIFHRSGTIWTEQTKLIASDGANNDVFGLSVSIDGDYTLVGAQWDNDNGNNSGSAYIFHRNGTTWTELIKLIASDGNSYDLFGSQVSIDGDCIVVGAYYDNDNGYHSGSAYFYRAVNYWDGSSSHNWSNSNNWSLERVPDADEDVVIPDGTPNDPWIYVSDGFCNSLLIESGANLRIDDEVLTVTNDVTIHGQLTMDDNLGELIIGDDIIWESGSTANISASSAEIFVNGDWNFEDGANVQLDMGYIDFQGSSNSYIRTYDEDCYFYHLRNNKAGSQLAHSTYSTQSLQINGNLYIYSDCELVSNSDESIVIAGYINNMDGYIHLDDGTVILDGVGSTSNFMPGDYFHDLTISSTGTTTFDDAIDIKDDLSIDSGVFDPDDNTIEIGGNWRNYVGDAGFIEGSGRVIFYREDAEMCYCYGETFNILEIDKETYHLYITNGSEVTCNSYDWTSGGMTVGYSDASFTALDLVDNGLYGRYQVQMEGTIDLHQDVGDFIDLNGYMSINNGGIINVYGGGDDSWWTFNGDVDFSMNEGILDFKDKGIKIHDGPNSLILDITGGTIRTSGDFTGDRADFNPAGGTIELYGSLDVTLSHGAGSSFYDVNINKSSSRAESGSDLYVDRNGNTIRRDRSNTVYAFSDLEIDGDLLISNGTFGQNGHTVDVAQNVDIYGTLQMFNFADVLNIGDDIYWRSGSNSNLTHGSINLDNNWYFYDGTNAQFGTNNTVSFVGSESQFIYCFDDDAEFNDVVIDNTTWAIWIHATSTDTMRVVGDMTVTAGDVFQVETSDLLINGILDIEDTGALYLEDVGGTMTNNSDFTLNGELNIDGGDALIHGEFELAETGILTIDSGSFISDNPYHSRSRGWEYIGGTLNLSDGLYESTYNSPCFDSTSSSTITGGTIRTGFAFSAEHPGTFEPTGGEVEFIGEVEFGPRIICSNGNYFHNFFMNRTSGTSNLHSDIVINNDITINSGELNVIGFGDVYNISVGGNWTNNAGVDGFLEETGTVTFFGNNDAQTTTDETFYNLVLDKTSSRGDILEIPASNTVNVTNDLNIDDGVLVLNDNSNLNIGIELNVNSGGTLDITCSNGNEAIISHYLDFYDFNIESGATILANYGIFEYMSLNGLYIKTGAIIDGTHSLNNCTFQFGEESGTLLRIDNDQTFTANNANFPTNTWSGTSNVMKSVDSGEVTFTNATGDFAGPDYEDDVNNRIHWDGFAPDLEITDVAWTDTNPYVCEQITATVTVYNNGNVSIPAGTSFYVDLYYDLPSPPNPFEYGDQYELISSGIPTGDFITVDFDVVWDIAESWDSYVQVDADGVITELDEGNNVWGADVITWNELPAIDDLTIQYKPDTDEIQLNWTYPINVDYFNIYRSEEPYDFSGATVVTSPVNSYMETPSGTKYFYRVTAVKDCTPTVVMSDNMRKKTVTKVNDR